MVTRDSRRGAPRRSRLLLTRREWAYLLALLVPFAVYDLALKVSLIASRPEDAGLTGALGLLRSDLLFTLGFALLWIGLFAVARKGLLRWIVVALFHGSTILVALVVTGAYRFFTATGSPLDFHTILYSLSNLGEVLPVAASEASPMLWLLVSAVLAYAILGPWLLTRFVGRWRGWPATQEEAGTPRASWLGAVGSCLAAYAMFSFALLPGGPADARESFSRDAFINVVAEEMEESTTEETATNPEVTGLARAAKPAPAAELVETAQTQKRNVVVVVLDSTRARSVTPYKSLTPSDQEEGEPTITPFMDELAKDSLLAERAYAVVPHTTNGLTAINCGINPPPDRRGTETLGDGIPARCLPELLGEQGYRTAFFSSATGEFERRREVVENFGYQDFFPVESMDPTGFEEANYFGYEDAIMLDPSRRWLQQRKPEGQPFMATYLTVTAHHDYRAPDNRYGREDFGEEDEVNRYLNTVRYEDYFLRDLFEQYKEMGLYEDTVFVIVGDHGEAFGEHDGRRQHDNVPYEEGLRIPMIVHDPQRFNGSVRVGAPVNQTDILPTVADLLGYGIRGGEYDGNSLRAIPEDRALNFSCWGDRQCLASLKGNEKYIYHYGNQPDEVFDLSKDPLEQRNLAEDLPDEEIERRRNALLEWRKGVADDYGG
ncbi:sulfatase-like hydrolase/transferase (plasmid) [Rubrobacter marinus]|uniref:Sulfatase-like hydrolase/transferase n=1 Tax=Rubrobacter marinus TaxID=2653852 RepID=A0A6G8Q3K0_9ACTN|nr:alkaline phosphatase family protein [Rubrobacter marinus]QIN81033.1 sulfatase-like hydrolase/transferase [Rubrobacter marinus]